MVGQSKWSKDKHSKIVADDARRGKLSEELTTRISATCRQSTSSGEITFRSHCGFGSDRTPRKMRLIFSNHHGILASCGKIPYAFRRRGQVTIPRASIEDDRLLELALNAGAKDVTADEEHHLATTSPDWLFAIAESRKAARASVESQKLTHIPETTVQLTDEQRVKQVIRLNDPLDENDEVQHVHANCDVSEDILAKISG